MSVPPLRKILCVEDEPLVQALARAALEKRGGFTVLACASGAAALDAAPAFAPDLLLLDVMMPGMDGPATLAASARAGVIGMIDKPFDPKTLAEAIAALWARSHGANATDGAR